MFVYQGFKCVKTENDLWEIPFYLSKQYPFYKFYIRHYTDITTETILYAVER